MWVPTIPAQLVFCHLNQTTFFQLLNGGFSPNLATTHESIYPRNVLETMFENFQFGGYLTQKHQNCRRSSGTNTDVLWPACPGDTHSSFRVVVQVPGSLQGLVNFFVRHTVSQLYGASHFSNFRTFAYFSYTKRLKYVPFRWYACTLVSLSKVCEYVSVVYAGDLRQSSPVR